MTEIISIGVINIPILNGKIENNPVTLIWPLN